MGLIQLDYTKPINEVSNLEEILKQRTETYENYLELFESYLVGLYRQVKGKMINYHTHMDRAFTLELAESLGHSSNMSMPDKQKLMIELQRQTYTEDSILERGRRFLIESYITGVRKVWTGANILHGEEDPYLVIKTLNKLKEEFLGKVDLKVLAYSMGGFYSEDNTNLNELEEGLKISDGLLTLPELDSRKSYGKHLDRIGFKASVERTLKLALKYEKPIQLHLDQKNERWEGGIEYLLKVIEGQEGIRENLRENYSSGKPLIYAVHGISTACRPIREQEEIFSKMSEYNIGLIVCPTAALGMKLGYKTGEDELTHNSIVNFTLARKKGVKVYIGTDNCNDIFIPNGTTNLLNELHGAINGNRSHDKELYRKVLTGKYDRVA